jgi:pilus assembly protein Flp/PilA
LGIVFRFAGVFMLKKIHKFLVLVVSDARGVTAIEYALIAALIAVVIIGAVTSLGGGVSSTFNSVSSEL